MSNFQERIDAVLAFTQPQHPAETVFDHEEWARFYLNLLTNSEYLALRRHREQASELYGTGNVRLNPGLFSDAQLLQKARMHADAAKILKELEALHGA